MWSIEIGGFPFFQLYGFFIIYSFLGWLMESIFVSVSNGRWINRGFISGPFCPIYGTGAVLVIVLLAPFQHNRMGLFLGGIVVATVLEYLISFLLEKIFHATWWDYSNMPFNLRGRICLIRSLEWGVLTVIMIRVIQPPIQHFVEWIPQTLGEFLGVIILAYLILDTCITVMNIFQFKEKMARLGETRLALREKMENIKLFEARKDVLDYLESLPIAEVVGNIKVKIEECTGQLVNLKEEEQLRLDLLMSEFKEKLDRHERILRKSNITERRLMKAFPGLTFKKYNDEFRAFKKEILQKNKLDEKKGHRQ
ncbi:hypothetical protein [Anaerotignum sp.]|uniref:putative ABC transporter permease n=1 Tax=Anaerotignum sp. TaxID=2039241 RepID=UPI00332D30DE